MHARAGRSQGQAGARAGPQRPAVRCKPCRSVCRGPAPRPSYNRCFMSSERKNQTRPGGHSPAPSFQKPAGVAKCTLLWVGSRPRPGPWPRAPSAGTARRRLVLPPSPRRAPPTQRLHLGSDKSSCRAAPARGAVKGVSGLPGPGGADLFSSRRFGLSEQEQQLYLPTSLQAKWLGGGREAKGSKFPFYKFNQRKQRSSRRSRTNLCSKHETEEDSVGRYQLWEARGSSGPCCGG